jgi:hypothetical protein
MKKETEKRNWYGTSLRFVLGFFMLLVVNSAFAIDYYIDSLAGSDSANGTTIATPWENLSKLNALILAAGDKIYLKSGSVWNGQQLKFGGSGSAVLPIIVDKYGTGAKPILNGNGFSVANQGVVYLYNQDYIEINNLEITNYPTLLLYANSIAYTLNQIVYNGTNAYQVTVAGTTPASGGAPIHTTSTGVSGTVTFAYYCKLTNLPYPDNMFFAGITDHPTETNPRSDNPLGADRRGVMVAIKDDGIANHIYLKNLNIHHIKGQLGNGQLAVNGAIPKRTAGIYFAVLNEASSSNSRFNDILIDGCDINYVENTGLAFDNEDNVYYPGGTELALWTARKFTNIKVSNNVIHHIGKNAMIIRCTDETGLIEYNTCYETALGTTGNTMFSARAKGTVFQYNEGYFNRSTTQNVDPGNIDGSMYDPDYGSVGVIFQYSYSHDNSEGIYWGCNTRGLANNTSGIPDPEDVGCTLRYCISQNDMGDLIFFNYPSAGNEIYNNVFYIKPGLSSKIIHESSTKNHTYNFYNNIIFDAGDATYAWSDPLKAGVQTRNFKNNVFYGIPAQTQIVDPQILTSDPLFVNPGKGTIGINALLDGYKLQPTSPALANGRIINPNGGLDFFGNLLNTTSAPNRGMYEGSGYNNYYYYKGSGSVAAIGNWGSNLNGSGTNPINFASNYQVFTVTNTPALIIDVPLTFANLEIQGSSVLLSADVIVNNNLTVGLLGNVTVSAGKNLTVKNALINNAIAGASAVVIESGANLIQANNVANTNAITIKRNSNSLHRLDYTLWSSPVSGAQTLANFSPLTSQSPNRFYTYNTSGNQYVAATFASPFESGKGYLIRMPNTDLTANYDAGIVPINFSGVFTGTPNNGTFNITTVPTKYNALGNPYPSVIDANLFKASNSDINTLYFWRKTNNPNQGTSPTTSYAVYNIASATGAGVAPDGAAAGQPTIIPDKYIQVGQGFLFTTAQTNVVFNNGMRIANNGNKFLKTKQIEQSRIWLNLSNTSWPINQMALCYMDGALVGLDETDSKYINDSPIALTSNIDNGEYTIQGRPTFDASDLVALNFKTDLAGVYTIAIDHTDGVFAKGQDVYLLDSTTGTETDLKASSYTFTATAGLDSTRFSLKYQKTLKVDASAFNESSLSVYKKNGTLFINSEARLIHNIKVFDIQGRLLAEQKNVKANTATIKDLKAIRQVLIIKILGDDGNIVTKKVAN